MTLCDAHFHIVQCSHLPDFKDFHYCASSCAHDQSEFLHQEKLIAELKSNGNASIVSAFGLHPQNPILSRLDFLKSLCEEGRIGAIGEAGFDLFSPEFSRTIHEQEEAWKGELELSQRYSLPLVIHCRKATDRLFRDVKELKKVPAVIFHSYGGTKNEALSFLKKGVNAFFSFGKPLLNGKKSAIECTRDLDASRLLFETDAPFQTLKGECETLPSEILRVYQEAARIRCVSLEELSARILLNFRRAFLLQDS